MTSALAEPLPTGAALSASDPRCVLCHTRLRVVLDLGLQPLANGLLDTPEQDAPWLPLRLASCSGCGHTQLAEFAQPEAMFGTYVYRTGASAPAVRHFTALADLIRQRIHGAAGWVCDVGSNDGTLLRALRGTRPTGLKALGVDPSDVAQNVEGTVSAFFNRKTAANLLCDHGPARVVTLCNVLAHCPDPLALIEGARDLLPYGGLLVIEAPYVYDLVSKCAYDTVYHEHFHYYSASVLQRLLTPNGFVVEKVERLPVHGGSLRVWARRVADVQRVCYVDPNWTCLLEHERPIDWARFADQVREHDYRLRELCAGGCVGFGAPAKATVLLNHTGIRPVYVVDSTPEKQGRFIPGVRVPIRPEEELGDPERILLLAWNYADAILPRYPQFAGRWIVPFPRPEKR